MIITNETIKCIKSFLPDEDCYSCSSCMYYTESNCTQIYNNCYLQQAFDLLNQINEMLKDERTSMSYEYKKVNDSNKVISNSNFNHTCANCADNKICPYAYDDYCTDGDCLLDK